MNTRNVNDEKCFDIEAYYRNKDKTFSFGPLLIGM